jgi:hypothetical protein
MTDATEPTTGRNSPNGEISRLAMELSEMVLKAMMAVDPVPLSDLGDAPAQPGVYGIEPSGPDPWGLYLPALHSGEPLYIGSTAVSLSQRLGHHVTTACQADGLDPDLLVVRYLAISAEACVAAERHLIRTFVPVWNDGSGLSGFGSRPPGRGRPGLLASWFHSLHRGVEAFEAIPLHRDPAACRRRITEHYLAREG